MKNKKRVFAIILCVVMLCSTAAVYAADAKADAGPRTPVSGTVGMVRIGDMEGRATYSSDSSGTNLDYFKVTITVERKYSTGWAEYYEPYELFGNAKNGSMLIEDIITVNANGTYRVKAVFEDKKNGIIMTTSAVYSQAVSL